MRHTSDALSIDHLALAVLRKDDQIVLVQQHTSPAPAPYWVLPGGLVEAGELIVEALLREVQEETGAQVTAIAHLACCSQIDRPMQRAQTLVFVYEIAAWHGTLQTNDPDAEVQAVALVPRAEAIHRLRSNGSWTGVQAPVLAYLEGSAHVGTCWYYRDAGGDQHLVAVVPG